MGLHIGKFQSIADIFTNYDSLTPDQQQVMTFLSRRWRNTFRLCANWAVVTSRFVAAGYAIVRSENRAGDRITFDGRYYSSVRGVGGLTTASGVEYLDAAMRGISTRSRTNLPTRFTLQYSMTRLKRPHIRIVQ